jgi:hypothetical protein
MPTMPLIARAARLFLISAVDQLATEYGIRQFIDIDAEASAELTRRYNQLSSATITPRDRDQVTRFFDGLEPVPPGVVPISELGLSSDINPTVGGLVGYCGIGRKP